MAGTISSELYWMAAVAVLTALLWAPHILSLIGQMGLGPALMDGQHETALEAAWARRAKRAHDNATANLAVFAPLAVAVHVAGVSSDVTAAACAVYFFARLGHYIVYALGLPLIRTLLFAVGVVCQVILGIAVMGLL